ncbi:MAG: pantoate--beta-alanine ligase [Deltaproteobacteria bacterium]|jgi:pantoate--beta-alanine ligase|nr:pantoate--beta-alanine ligase [Deltaproteobacteria bacterium]
MLIITDPAQMAEQCAAWRQAGQSVALVPTMGFFHQGHESLMQAARKNAAKVVLSLFVNPTQFAPTEDLAAYPRDMERDKLIAEGNGVDVLFAPTPELMYPQGYDTWTQVPGLSRLLCGKTRPTHFKGVCTVVLKLFNITRPDLAFFGQKDWQQLAIIRRMAGDLNLGVKVEGVPIVREADGLAMSSRNSYLGEAERTQAPQIHKGLTLARQLFAAGETRSSVLRKRISEFWQEKLPLGRVDYLELVHPETLKAEKTATPESLVITAVYLGKARLIDNQILG